MRYRRLGRTGVKVSAVGLGSWLTYGGTVAEEAATACVQRAFERGVTFFDTANVYAGGRAEEIMGAALSGFRRDDYVLATKVYFPVGKGPNDSGLSRKHVWEQAHRSLRRLSVEYIDLYQCHRYDAETSLDETCRVMDDLIRAGKILYWGTSEWTSAQLRDATELCRSEGWSPPACNQPQYSALQRRIEATVLPTTEELGIGNVVWSPLAQGVLTGKYSSPDDLPEGSRAAGRDRQFMEQWLTAETLQAVAAVGKVADQVGCTLAQLALAWCLRQPAVSSVIAGATRPEHVDANVVAADLDIDPEILDTVSDLLDPVAVR